MAPQVWTFASCCLKASGQKDEVLLRAVSSLCDRTAKNISPTVSRTSSIRRISLHRDE